MLHAHLICLGPHKVFFKLLLIVVNHVESIDERVHRWIRLLGLKCGSTMMLHFILLYELLLALLALP